MFTGDDVSSLMIASVSGNVQGIGVDSPVPSSSMASMEDSRDPFADNNSNQDNNSPPIETVDNPLDVPDEPDVPEKEPDTGTADTGTAATTESSNPLEISDKDDTSNPLGDIPSQPALEKSTNDDGGEENMDKSNNDNNPLSAEDNTPQTPLDEDKLDLDTNDDTNPYSDEEDNLLEQGNTDTNDNTIGGMNDEDFNDQSQDNFSENSRQNPMDPPPTSLHEQNDSLNNSTSELPNGSNGDPFGQNTHQMSNQDHNSMTNQDHMTNQDTSSSNAFAMNHNGSEGSDPFGASNHNDFGGTSDDVFDLLGNGTSDPPALLDEDANDLLDQLVDFPVPHTKQSEHELNHS